jgi:hypothetical protein
MHWKLMTAALVIAAWAASAAVADELQKPAHIMVKEIPLDVERVGHSAPFAGDFDGDGAVDLLVGQYEGGKLRIYMNVGTTAEPRFENYEWFQAGGQDGRVPEG